MGVVELYLIWVLDLYNVASDAYVDIYNII